MGEGIVTLWPRVCRITLLTGWVILAQVNQAVAADLKILTPRSVWPVVEAMGPKLERTSGSSLIVVADIAATLSNQFSGGEGFDVFIGPPVQMDRLIRSNNLL